MTDSDIIASGAVVVSIFNIFYTYRSSVNISNNNLIKEQYTYLRQLAKIIHSFSFEKGEIDKQNILNEIREELTYCSCFQNNDSFEKFSCEIDDNTYCASEAENKEDFEELKNKILTSIEKFKNTK